MSKKKHKIEIRPVSESSEIMRYMDNPILVDRPKTYIKIISDK